MLTARRSDSDGRIDGDAERSSTKGSGEWRGASDEGPTHSAEGRGGTDRTHSVERPTHSAERPDAFGGTTYAFGGNDFHERGRPKPFIFPSIEYTEKYMLEKAVAHVLRSREFSLPLGRG